ncbi:MAG: hypothetical protein SVU32_06620 [Candidatus Nanohaloarchaea archaeon]|nr:hypothetical protein [Candidatus Nanohaloarchaea archaeon]
MQGDDVPLDVDYLKEEDLHDEFAELYEEAQDMDIVLDIDSEYGEIGAMTRGSPKR